jgi:hypothetical protein
MTVLSILRVRPHDRVPDGPPAASYTRLASLLEGNTAVRKDTVKFDPDGVLDSDFLDLLSSRIASMSQSSYLVLDIGYQDDRRRDIGMALTHALNESRDSIVSTSCRILVVMSTLWPISDVLVRTLTGARWSSMTTTIDMQGQLLGLRDDALARHAIECLTVTWADMQEELRRRLIRLRGVFAHGADDVRTYTKFRYVGDFTRGLLVPTLKNLLDEAGSDAIILAHDTSDWFKSAIKASALERNIPVVVMDTSTGTLLEDQLEIVSTFQGMHRPRISLAVPITRQGRSLARLYELASKIWPKAGFHGLSVYAARVRPLGTQELPCGFKRPLTLAGNDSISQYFLVPVEWDYLTRDDWLYKIAVHLGDVQAPPHDWFVPTRSGLLWLFSELKLDIEEPYHPRAGRPRIRHLPMLRDLQIEDAKWLAYSMLRRVDAPLDSTLVILPREQSGAAALAYALEKCLGVAVVTVGRDESYRLTVLEEDDREVLEDYTSKTIVVMDESVMSGDSLQELSLLVEQHAGGRPRKVVALKAPTHERALEVDALYEWFPSMFVGVRNEQ